MQITPEMKAQIEEQKKECVYCKIVKGEIPGKVVYEDEKTEAIIDIYPAKKGHTVFMLKEHYPIMPYIPPDEFKQFFGLVPQVCKAIQSAMVSTGVNMYIANGGAAGQQFPHFYAHLFPRDESDGFFNFFWKRNASLEEEKKKVIAHNFPIMMANHFGRNPASWHTGNGEVPNFLKQIYESSTVIYEDEKVLCVIPEKGVTAGHIEIYSKNEEHDISKLSQEDSAHLFFTASFAATALFEGLQAHGTNIILKSGVADDNPEGRLCVHVLPRVQGDGLESMYWQPKQPEYDLDAVAGKIKDKVWKIKYDSEKISASKIEEPKEPKAIKVTSAKETSSEEEIKRAIEGLQ